MKLIDVILLSLAAAFLIIGVHQLIVITNNVDFSAGFTQSYWIFMLAICLFLAYRVRQNKSSADAKVTPPTGSQKPAPKTKSARKASKPR